MRHALRALTREKAFAGFAIVTLALGIAAVTTMFSIIDGVLLKPLPYKEAARLYAAAESLPKIAAAPPRLPVNASHLHSWLEQCRSCESAALLNPAAFNLTGIGEPERIDGVLITWRLFQILGVEPQLGRTFTEIDDRPGANRFVVISDGLWRRRFAADPAVVGRAIQIDSEPHVVIGVLRPDFHLPSGDRLGPLNQFPKHADIFKPMGFNWPGLSRVGQFNFSVVMRLREGASPARAEAEMTAAVADSARLMKTPVGAHLVPLQEQVTGASRRSLFLLWGAVGAVLLIVCVNLGNLMLVRAIEHSRAAAIRRALGAGAAQLFRPALAESLLIGLIGGAMGLALTLLGVQLLVKTAPVDIPRLDEVHVNLATMLFAFGVSVACGVACGLWPALRAMHVEPADALRSGSRSATVGRAGQRSREWLVGVEVALSTVLLIMAALLGVSFFHVSNVNRGYVVDHVLTTDVTLPHSRYRTDDQRALFHQRALEKIEALPDVRSAGLVSSLPLKAQAWGDAISTEGDARPRAERPMASFRFFSEHYFETMGIALLQGRFATAHDRSQKVALVSESAARKAWGAGSPIGKRIRNDPRTDWVEVIGVVADVRTDGLDKQPPPIVYVPYWDGVYWQGAVWGEETYAVRTAQDPAAMANAVRSAIHELDAELPLANMQTMRDIFSGSMNARRFQTALAGIFALTALLLASLGIYGVISYTVNRRRGEIGIRIALGAQTSQVFLLVFSQGARPVVGGLIVGIAAALATGELIRSFLFGAQPQDPVTIAAIAAFLLLVSAAACWSPARRAAGIDPATALRNE